MGDRKESVAIVLHWRCIKLVIEKFVSLTKSEAKISEDNDIALRQFDVVKGRCGSSILRRKQ